MLGGKWTTFRKMGEDMIDNIEKTNFWKPTVSRTASLAIYGSTTVTSPPEPLYFYGSDLSNIVPMIRIDPDGWISTKLHLHRAQVIWAVREELARTTEDVLARRTRALFLDAREAIRIAPEVAELIAKESGRDGLWVESQVKEFRSLAKQYCLNIF